jgi:hypothetical protein
MFSLDVVNSVQLHFIHCDNKDPCKLNSPHESRVLAPYGELLLIKYFPTSIKHFNPLGVFSLD